MLADARALRPDRRGTGDYLAEGVTNGGRHLRVVVMYDPIRRILRPITAWEVK
ncbi:MAG: hypothetical protein ACRDWN_08080 [Acidimicrobiales bacterium]